MGNTDGSPAPEPDGDAGPRGAASSVKDGATPGSLPRQWYTEEMEVAAANALLDAGFIDPDDGTIPQWHAGDPSPWWTHPSGAVKVALEAISPMVEKLLEMQSDGAYDQGYEVGYQAAGGYDS